MAADKIPKKYAARLTERRWMSHKACEIRLGKPTGFTFAPGQFVRLLSEGRFTDSGERDYSLISIPSDADIALLVRDTGTGGFSSFLCKAKTGTAIDFFGPRGYFTYRETGRTAVFVATGTGIAPFVSMARSGISGFVLLHGVETKGELYYESLFRGLSCRYVPCLSGEEGPGDVPGAFSGRVTAYLADRLAPGAYDFYLCGRREMIREATLLIDRRFPDARIYTETFF